MFIVHKEALSSKKLDKNELLFPQAKISIRVKHQRSQDFAMEGGLRITTHLTICCIQGQIQKVLVGRCNLDQFECELNAKTFRAGKGRK